MCKKFGYDVIKLERIRIMNLMLDNLGLGEWRYVSDRELEELKRLIDSPPS
jgi:23S rRNA pseudouridine2604 synthase